MNDNRAVINRKENGNIELNCVLRGTCIRLEREPNETLDKFFDKLSSKISKVLGCTYSPKQKSDVANASDEKQDMIEPGEESLRIVFLGQHQDILYSNQDSQDVLQTFTLESLVKCSSFMQIANEVYKLILNPLKLKKLSIPQKCFIGLPTYISISPPNMVKDVFVAWYVCSADEIPKVKKKRAKQKKEFCLDPGTSEKDTTVQDYQSHLAQRVNVFDIELVDPAEFAEYRQNGYCCRFAEYDLGKFCLAKVYSPENPDYFGLAISASPLLEYVSKPQWNIQRMATLPKKEHHNLRVCSWNILAPVYTKSHKATGNLFPYCSAEHLDYNYRRGFIARELLDLDADLLCLQECGQEVKDDLLASFCAHRDMHHHFCPKLSRANEGLFIAWKYERFKVLDRRCIPFRKSSIFSNESFLAQLDAYWPNFLESTISRMSAVFQFIFFEDLFTKRRLLVSNTHLYWHPNASHIRTIQTYALLVELGDLYTSFYVNESTLIDVIVCGDLNADDHTGTIDLMTTGVVASTHISWLDAPKFAEVQQNGGEPVSTVIDKKPVQGLTLLNKMNLLQRSLKFGELEFTTTIGTFHAVLDWIFVSPAFKVVYALPGVALSSIAHDSSETVGEENGVPPGLPTAKFPSDHIPVLVEIRPFSTDSMIE